MHITELNLFNYRNITDAKISLCEGVNLFLGRNAQGKTNLLESIYILGVGKSFRSGGSGNLSKFGENFSEVRARLVDNLGNSDLVLALNEGRKTVSKNGERVKKASNFFGNLLVVCFNPDDLLIVKSSPSYRRKFIDKHVVDVRPAILDSYIRFAKAVSQKNELLKKGASLKLLEPWNEIIISESVVIRSARLDIVRKVQSLLQAEYSELFGVNDRLEIGIKVSGLDGATLGTDNLSASDPDPCTVDGAREMLNRVASDEQFRRRSLFGPQRDDLIISIEGSEAREFASQGQARSIILAMKLAMTKVVSELREEKPIVLLDDADSELDPHRQSNFLRSLLSRKYQVVLTSTAREKVFATFSESGFSKSNIQDIGISEFAVESGNISPLM